MIDQWSCNDLDDDHHRPPHLQPPWITIQYLWKSLPPPSTSPQRRKWNIDPDNLICTLFMRSDFSLSPKVGKLLSNLYQSIWFYNQKQCSYIENKSECEMSWLVYINFLSFFQFNRRTLSRLNVAQLQLIQNDYLAQIETLNEELVGLLVTRDELGMEQDAMLTDIEDLSEFINIEKAWSWSEAWPVIDLTQSSVIQTFPFEGQYFSRINIWESQYSKLDYIELVNSSSAGFIIQKILFLCYIPCKCFCFCFYPVFL